MSDFDQRIGVGRQLRQVERRADVGVALAVVGHQAGVDLSHAVKRQVVERGGGVVRAVDGVVHDARKARGLQGGGAASQRMGAMLPS